MSFLQRQWVAKRLILDTAREVRERTGKSVASQLSEITRLRFGSGELRAEDYFMTGAYDDRRYRPAAKRQVLSWPPERLARALNDPAWGAVCHDKLTYHEFLRQLGLPTPTIHAAYVEGERDAGSVTVLRTPEALASFLRDGMTYPFFGKPMFGQFGRGVSSVAAYQPAVDRLRFTTGEQVGVDEYVREYVLAARKGYIFQQPIAQHPDVDRITGGRVASLRMVVLRGDDGPRLFRTVWRIPVGRNITDNFQHGAQGNLLADVDRRTGRVVRVVQVMTTDDHRVRLPAELERHPDTGEQLRGAILPDWDAHVALCLRAAKEFEGLRYQSWDVVMGADGPLLLEINFRGSIDVIQIPGADGLYDAEFREFWSRYARSG
ncbi:MAG: sugar-transfer associated ATP-grasp domain-containing protein [Gemmatimonadaceae bacterium]